MKTIIALALCLSLVACATAPVSKQATISNVAQAVLITVDGDPLVVEFISKRGELLMKDPKTCVLDPVCKKLVGDLQDKKHAHVVEIPSKSEPPSDGTTT